MTEYLYNIVTPISLNWQHIICYLKMVSVRMPIITNVNQFNLSFLGSGSGESDGTVYGNYNEAAWHGQEGHQCHTRYPLCAFTANQIMEEYRKYLQEENTHEE